MALVCRRLWHSLTGRFSFTGQSLGYRPRYNIAPAQEVLTVIRDDDGATLAPIAKENEMTVMLSFRLVTGESVFRRNKLNEEEIDAVLKLDISSLVTLNTRGYRIVGVNDKSKQGIMQLEFTVEPVNRESA